MLNWVALSFHEVPCNFRGIVGNPSIICCKEGLPGGVSHLMYMTTPAVPEGKSMVDAVRDFGHEELLPLAFDFADDKSLSQLD